MSAAEDPQARSRSVALVTGASRGLGAAIARRLAADGHDVAVNYATSDEAAQAVVVDIEQAGGRAMAVRADITDEAGVAALRAEVRKALGPVSVLVVNATGPQPAVPAAETRWADVERHFAFFVRSPVLLLAEFLPDLRAAASGRVVHIGSDVVTGAPVGNSGYVAAKSAQLGLARVWAKELAPLGITVNTVAPGWVPVERHGTVSADELRGYVEGVPVGRLGTAAEVAGAVAYLASPEAAFVNGAVLHVNGGSILA